MVLLNNYVKKSSGYDYTFFDKKWTSNREVKGSTSHWENLEIHFGYELYSPLILFPGFITLLTTQCLS